MEVALLGWPEDGPTLRLDWRRFAYAGKFATSNTGKAVVREAKEGGEAGEARDAVEADDGSEFDDGVIAAASFNADRTDPDALWLRYVTVREDHRGDGLGPRLCAFVAERAAERGYERVRIGVNNPFAYEALYSAGFAFTGETTGLAELVLERRTDRPAARDPDRYRAGLDRYRERDLSDEEATFLDRKEGASPPPLSVDG